MRNILTGAVVFLVGAGILSSIILGVRALNDGMSADLLGPAIAIAAFILPATFLAIQLMDIGSTPPPPPTLWPQR